MPIKVNRVYPKQAKVSNPFNTYNTIPWWSRDAFGLFIKCFVVLLKYSSLYHMLRNPLPNVGLSHYLILSPNVSFITTHYVVITAHILLFFKREWRENLWYIYIYISTALMRPRRPKQFCLQLDIALWHTKLCFHVQIEHSTRMSHCC